MSSDESKTQIPLAEVMEKFLKLPYYENAAASSGAIHTHAKHEDALKEVMCGSGYSVWKPAKPLKKGDQGDPTFAQEMPCGSFVEQPFGSQCAPDFFVKTWNNQIVPIEAKSSKGYSPCYNSGGVNPNCFYVFCSKKTNQTTIYKGDDIISQEQSRLISEYIAEEKARVAILNQKLKALDVTERGVSYYARPMITQSGCKELTNYFTHEKRAEIEQRAIDVVKELEV
jgi:hypothetical protein